MHYWWLVPAVITAVSAVAALRKSRRLWDAVDTPTLPTGHVALGRVEVVGAAGQDPQTPVVSSPFQPLNCAYWMAELQESRDPGNREQWKTQQTFESARQITVDDGTGPVVVHLKEARLLELGEDRYDKSEWPAFMTRSHLSDIARGAPYLPELPDEKSSDRPISQLEGRWRIVERYIPAGASVYVFGSTRFDELRRRAVFEHSSDRPLLVHLGDEASVIGSSRLGARAAAALAMGASWVTVAFLRGAIEVDALGKERLVPNWRSGIIGPWFLLLAVAVAQAVRIRNRVVATAEQVRAAHRLVDIAEAKREELIPQLVSVVRAAATHERELQPLIAELRAGQAVGAELAQLVEATPTLRANENFLALQRALIDVESDIAAARGFLVDAETVHRTRIESFPDSWLAPLVTTGGPKNASTLPRHVETA